MFLSGRHLARSSSTASNNEFSTITPGPTPGESSRLGNPDLSNQGSHGVDQSLEVSLDSLAATPPKHPYTERPLQHVARRCGGWYGENLLTTGGGNTRNSPKGFDPGSDDICLADPPVRVALKAMSDSTGVSLPSRRWRHRLL